MLKSTEKPTLFVAVLLCTTLGRFVVFRPGLGKKILFLFSPRNDSISLSKFFRNWSNSFFLNSFKVFGKSGGRKRDISTLVNSENIFND